MSVGTIRFIPFEDGSIYGRLVVEHTYPRSNEPVMDIYQYPVFNRCRRDEFEDIIDRSADDYGQYNGVYHVYNSRTGQSLRVILKDGKDTKAEQSQEPIKPPRAKQVRWLYGRWEKYTQAKGWVPVY